MALTNLKTEQTKTVTVAGVKLVTPADRIGLGFGTVLAYPADNLSRGQFPLPPNPEPEQLRSRQDQSAPHMRKQMRTGESDAVPPAGPAQGSVSFLQSARHQPPRESHHASTRRRCSFLLGRHLAEPQFQISIGD